MFSKKYHNIFDYELVRSDFPKWQYKSESSITSITSIKSKKRKDREKYSKQKLIIAKKASQILSKIPTVKFVGITGSLAMMNAKKDSDIDLMIVTSAGMLWSTRLISLICLLGQIRRFDDRNQKDKLCLNMWLDQDDLVWKKSDRNVYTAHEIGQIVPLVNKCETYEKFLHENKWILDYWPNSVEKKYMVYSKSYIGKTKIQYTIYNILHTWLEAVAFKLQYNHMKSKITREVITPTRALFHPQDWGKVVLSRLSS